MLDILILALRLVIVALLYLFLFFVVRMAVRGLRAPARAPITPVRNEARERLKLIVVEAGASDLSAGAVIELTHGATLGRGDQASVVISDNAVSTEHARIDRVGRAWVVTDLGSTNGTRVNSAPIKGRTSLANGDVLSLGNVRLEVRA